MDGYLWSSHTNPRPPEDRYPCRRAAVAEEIMTDNESRGERGC
jgi:hypothetical protein